MISKYKPVYSQSLPPPHGSESFDTNEHVDAGACAVALAGASLLAKPMLLAKNGDFLGMLIYARRDSLAENRAM